MARGAAGLDFGRFQRHIAAIMKVSDAHILIVPGYTNSGPEHWQTRWERKMSTARRVEQAEWAKPVREDWVARMVEEVNAAEKPVVIVAHSLGVATAVHALPISTSRSPAPSSSRHRTWPIRRSARNI